MRPNIHQNLIRKRGPHWAQAGAILDQSTLTGGVRIMSMSNEYEAGALPGRIALGPNGIGTISPEMVGERARELAKADGRGEANEKDRLMAREELLGAGQEPLPPEVDHPAVENLTSWDEPPEASGTRAPQVLPEDEANIGERLVQEGVEEADHESRVVAAEEQVGEEG